VQPLVETLATRPSAARNALTAARAASFKAAIMSFFMLFFLSDGERFGTWVQHSPLPTSINHIPHTLDYRRFSTPV
jgi:hypothetical protein